MTQRKDSTKGVADSETRKPSPKPQAAEAKTPAAKNRGGRPSIFTQALADRICSELAAGKSMRTVCKSDDMPSMDTVFRWIREKTEFSDQYMKAKQEAADALVEEMIDIADSGTNDWMEANDPDNPGYRANGEHIQRSRLRVETRKWIAAKLKPRKYGEKLDMNHGVQPDNPLATFMEQVTGTKFRVKGE